MRLLRPDALNEAFGGRFANLSMNSATAYEQWRIAEVFARNHRAAKTVIAGIDIVWCEDTKTPEKYTFRRFPEWMYDANRWNDVAHMLEFKTFEVLGRQAGYMLGLREARYGPDGYRSFLPPQDRYDLEKARRNIYGEAGPGKARPVNTGEPPGPPPVFGSHGYLESLLNAFPETTRKVLVFVPYHAHHQPPPGSRAAGVWDVCRARVAEVARAVPNTTILDFMIASPITMRDENYWDPLHYTNAVAEWLARLIAAGAKGVKAPGGEYRILFPEG